MMLMPGLGKRHALAVIGIGAVVVAGMIASRFPGHGRDGRAQQASVFQAPAVTMDGYRAAAAAAVKDLKPGDRASVAAAAAKLESLRVPKEGMAAHAELVTALAGYGAALDSGNGADRASALSRLRACAGKSPWLNLPLQ